MSVWEGGIDTCIYRWALSGLHGGAREEWQVSYSVTLSLVSLGQILSQSLELS